jgi:hypothetical protein
VVLLPPSLEASVEHALNTAASRLCSALSECAPALIDIGERASSTYDTLLALKGGILARESAPIYPVLSNWYLPYDPLATDND